ncbi:glycosyltransferase family 39 protein [Mucilaginibacter sp. CSA2-8R]|uniref:ArnT family glycosyltransferase n=1 Tax=Mucilaginibacter sp. CSA2-8R TaxID=3141542 RepID=UPI00315C7255
MQNTQPQPVQQLKAFVWIFVAVKVLLVIFTGGHYGFHRDELLHLTLGDHLDWGYMEVPPLIALLAKISTTVLGSSVMAARVFPAIASLLIIWFTGLLTIELGGKRFAITLACLCILFSPGMAASGYLFQPVVFDQLWWLLAAYLCVKYVNSENGKYLYYLGLVIGLGLLTKYTMAFFTGALLMAILLMPQRRLLWRKETTIAAAIAILLFLPNLWWQYTHHWPVVTHMTKLNQEQLKYIKPADFIIPQLLLHGTAAVVWIAGLLVALFHPKFAKYRFVGLAFLLVFAFLLKMNGKAYYLLAAYPMLFAAGGTGIEYWLKNVALRIVATILMIAPNLLLLPIVLPVLSINQALSFFDYYRQHLKFMDFAITWEDHKKHRTTQDYADMLGWEEIAKKTAAIYHQLTPAQQQRTVIFADNYGEAGALHVYHNRYQLPEVVCLNSSFALWAPEKLNAEYLIYVSDDNDVSDLQPVAESYQRAGMVENPLAREHGTGIFLIKDLKPGFENIYRQHRKENRLEVE